MDAQSVNSRANGRCEPRWFTLADLLMLTVGFALAFSLPRLHHLDDPFFWIGAQGIPMPGFMAHFLVVREAATKCGLILVPVILARRARYGGLPHPAEWLAILMALVWVHDAIAISGVIHDFAVWYQIDLRRWLGLSVDRSLEKLRLGGRDPVEVVIHRYRPEHLPRFTPLDDLPIWCGLATIVFVGLSIVLGVGRKRLPAWAGTTLLSLAALAGLEAVLSHLLPVARRHATGVISHWSWLPLDGNVLVAQCVESSLDGIVLVVPFVAAMLAVRTGPRKCWTWIGRMGATVAVLALAAEVAYAGTPWPYEPECIEWRQVAIESLRFVVAGLAGAVIVRWSGRISGSQPAAAGVEGAGH